LASTVVSAPGRVCLFGEHMDWNWRPVVSYATEAFRNYVKLTVKDSKIVKVRSYEPYNVQDQFQVDGEISYVAGDLNYIRAVVNVLKEMGCEMPGMELEVKTTIPVGTGLSSSAALCVSTAYAISEALGLGLNPSKAAEIAYTAERKRLGINCGQMDPYASALGGLCYIDCSAEPPRKVDKLSLGEPLPLIIGDTLTPRKAGKVLAWLGLRVKDEDPAMLEGVRRISALVDRAWSLLKAGDPRLEEIGRCMNENQSLLREYLRVSTFEIEELIYAGLKAGGLGGKLTGAGGGGCVIILARPEDLSRVAGAVEAAGGRAYTTDLAREGVKVEDPETFEAVAYPFHGGWKP